VPAVRRAPPRATTYGYDDLGNLETVTSPDGIETYARQYSAGGVALGPVRRVNPQSEFSFRFASDLRGGYLGTWMHRGSPSSFDLFGLALDASGAMLGTDFKLNQFSSRPFDGVVAGLPSGSVFVWTSSRTLVVTDVMARLYTPNGLPRGDQFRVGSGENSTELVAARSTVAPGRSLA